MLPWPVVVSAFLASVGKCLAVWQCPDKVCIKCLFYRQSRQLGRTDVWACLALSEAFFCFTRRRSEVRDLHRPPAFARLASYGLASPCLLAAAAKRARLPRRSRISAKAGRCGKHKLKTPAAAQSCLRRHAGGERRQIRKFSDLPKEVIRSPLSIPSKRGTRLSCWP